MGDQDAPAVVGSLTPHTAVTGPRPTLMRSGVKILLGLAMPALAVIAAAWLWSFGRRAEEDDFVQDERPNNTNINVNDSHGQFTRQELVDELNVECPDELENNNGEHCGAEDEKVSLETTTALQSTEIIVVDDNNEKDLDTLEQCESLADSIASLKELCLSDKSSNASTCESVSDEQAFQASQEEEIPAVLGEETWEIEFPQALCGRLIGKKGKNVQKISQATGTKIRLIPQKENTESSQRLVSLTGTPKQLGSALNALQEKFPSVPFKRLNGTSLSQSELPPVTSAAAITDTIRIALPSQGMFQVYVTSIVDANHFYVQLHDQTQTVQVMLHQLDQQMYQVYGTSVHGGGGSDNALLSVNTGVVCASYSQTGWWRRAQVVGLLMKPDEVEITWLDYGGKEVVPVNMLRPLRPEFLQLPLQVVECYLSNVIPHQGESTFSMTANAVFESLTQSCILTARVTAYNRGCPCVELYAPPMQWSGQPMLINRELVRRGYARWSER